MHGLALPRRHLPYPLIERYELDARTVVPDAKDGMASPNAEVQFLARHRQPLLPYWEGGEMRLGEWGNLRHTSAKLPRSHQCRRESFEEGRWAWMNPKPIRIPCSLLLDNHVWTAVDQDLEGVVLVDEKKCPHIYPLTVPSSHYYRIMTGSEREAVMERSQI